MSTELEQLADIFSKVVDGLHRIDWNTFHPDERQQFVLKMTETSLQLSQFLKQHIEENLKSINHANEN